MGIKHTGIYRMTFQVVDYSIFWNIHFIPDYLNPVSLDNKGSLFENGVFWIHRDDTGIGQSHYPFRNSFFKINRQIDTLNCLISREDLIHSFLHVEWAARPIQSFAIFGPLHKIAILILIDAFGKTLLVSGTHSDQPPVEFVGSNKASMIFPVCDPF